MAQDVKILTWNIQQYGPMKASFDDIVNAIAKVVVDIDPDIFILLEVNTTNRETASSVVKRLAEALHNESQGDFRVAVISPNTGREFYGFFIKDINNTVPLMPKRKNGVNYVSIIGDEDLRYSDVIFRKKVGGGVGVEVLRQFPLISPDLDDLDDDDMDIGTAEWPGTRLPALATFWCPGAMVGYQLLPIAVCHFAANHDLALEQFEALKYFSPLQGLGPPDPNGNIATTPITLDVDPLNTGSFPVTIRNYVLTGDFNLNYISDTDRNKYNYIIGNAFANLGARLYITEGTHLVTYGNFNRNMKFTLQLAVNDYDNLMLRNNPNTLPLTDAGAAGVKDIPSLIKDRTLTLYNAVKHYKELDQKGFSSNEYDYFAVNFGQQLSWAGTFGRSPINIEGSLVGARLISDHLPVYFTVRLP